MKSRIIELSVKNRKEVIELPVNPQKPEFAGKQLNQSVALLSGETKVKGKPGLWSTEISSFFPAKGSPFYKYAKQSPKKYIKQLKRWKKKALSVRFIDTDQGVDMAMTIDELRHSQAEGDKDIYYTLVLTEDPDLNVSSAKSDEKKKKNDNGLLDRPNTKEKPLTHTIKQGQTLYDIAKKHYGSGDKATKIYAANKTIIEKTAREHGKNSSHSGKYIYVGTVLTLPE